MLIAAFSPGFLQDLGNRSGENVVSIDMFVANVFVISFRFFSCLQGAYENSSHAKTTNVKSKEHEQKLTEDDLTCKHMTR